MRLYDEEDLRTLGPLCSEQERTDTICYCLLSSSKQKNDLARQVAYLHGLFPEAEIIKDIGSGGNYKRKGLRAILE